MSIKGFVTENGQALYDFNALENVPEVLKNIPVAKVGQLIIVKSVDAEGRITAFESIDREESGGNGEDGGYYIPSVSQPDANTLEFTFESSKEGMNSVEPKTIVLPAGKNGVGISSVVMNADYTLTFNFDDGTSYTTASIRGAEGFSPSVTVARNDTNNCTIIQVQTSGNSYQTATIYDGNNGDDGVSPTVVITAIEGGHQVTITDKDGSKSFNVMNGQDGYSPQKNVDYFDGKDGTSPMISVSAITCGHRITITDANGTKTIDVMDGSDGIGIASVKQTTTSTTDGGDNVFTVKLTNGTSATFTVKNGSKGNPGTDGKDYTFDPTGYDLPILYLTGDTSPIAVTKDNKVNMSYTYGSLSGTCTLKGQGATSYKKAKALVEAGRAGKFNYTINFDTKFEAVEGWGEQKKYCLKANWIDPTHSRNIVSCKLWGMIVKSRTNVPTQMENLPNGGAIDGFPIIIMLNGEFHGLYTMNIPKDGWMFGLDEDPAKTQAIVSAKDHTSATQFKEASMSGYEVEFASDEDNVDWVTTSIVRLINAVKNSDGSDLDTTIAQYLDWDSAIDYFIHTVVDKATDCVDKNFLLVTFDGVKWYFSNYDRDSIHGLNWDASGTTRPVSNCSFLECADTVRVFELIKRFKTNALKARYNQLRGNILSESRIMEKFENFAWAIPSTIMAEDVKTYPTILGSSVNTIDQIGRFVRQRLVRCDEWINALPAQESTGGSTVTTHAVTNKLTNCVSSNGASAVNAGEAYNATITANSGYTLEGASVTVTMGGTDITSTTYSNGKVSVASVTGAIVITVSAVKKASSYTNQVPISTDADGSIYNGTGYKDNVRLSSSGGISGTAQTGSVVTGFIPFTPGSTIRIKGAEFFGCYSKGLGHYYISFYDASKNSKVAVDEGNVTSNPGSCFESNYNETTGITTIKLLTGINSDWGKKIDASSFFRINAYGKGADLIVTVNEEIT